VAGIRALTIVESQACSVNSIQKIKNEILPGVYAERQNEIPGFAPNHSNRTHDEIDWARKESTGFKKTDGKRFSVACATGLNKGPATLLYFDR
jgi:hypothetical protein